MSTRCDPDVREHSVPPRRSSISSEGTRKTGSDQLPEQELACNHLHGGVTPPGRFADGTICVVDSSAVEVRDRENPRSSPEGFALEDHRLIPGVPNPAVLDGAVGEGATFRDAIETSPVVYARLSVSYRHIGFTIPSEDSCLRSRPEEGPDARPIDRHRRRETPVRVRLHPRRGSPWHSSSAELDAPSIPDRNRIQGWWIGERTGDPGGRTHTDRERNSGTRGCIPGLAVVFLPSRGGCREYSRCGPDTPINAMSRYPNRYRVIFDR